MAEDWLTDLLGDKEKLQKIFANNDITENASVKFKGRLSKNQAEIYNKAKKFFSQYWIKGLQNADVLKSLKWYSDDYPIKLVGNANANFIADAVTNIASSEKRLMMAEEFFDKMFGERFNNELSGFAKSKDKAVDDLAEKEIDKFTEDFINNLNLEETTGMIIGQKIPEIAEILKSNIAHEDFNGFPTNFKKDDFLRDWDHLRSKFGTLPDPNLDKIKIDQNPGTEAKAIGNIATKEFFESLDEKDRQIIILCKAGYTQNEIAKQLGMKNNSGVSKRIAKLKKDFAIKTGISIRIE